jgi:hypothetical protein
MILWAFEGLEFDGLGVIQCRVDAVHDMYRLRYAPADSGIATPDHAGRRPGLRD